MIRQICILSLLIFAQGKPVTYDQRQDGNFNLHAQLDNIMIVIATPGDKGSSSLFSDIASQILELRSLTSRNKKVSVEDEEIVEQGKNPLSVRILRIEDQNEAEENGSQSQGRGSLNQSEEPQGEEASANQIKTFGLPKIDDVKQILNKTDEDIKNTIKEVPNKIEHIKDKIIPELLEGEQKEILQKIGKPELGENLEEAVVPEKEIFPDKFISYGSIVEVDKATGKVVLNLENKKPLENKSSDQNSEKFDLQEKILAKSESEDKEKIIPQIQEKTPIVPQEYEKVEEQISAKIEDLKEVLPKKLEDQGEIIEEKIPDEIQKQERTLSSKEKKKEVSEAVENKLIKEKKIEVKIEDKVVPKGQRGERELRAPANDSKGRMSLKKELPRIEDLKEEDAPGDKNEVRLIVEEISQLKPIGDMIENCGPGRIRNRYGVCQFDETFN